MKLLPPIFRIGLGLCFASSLAGQASPGTAFALRKCDDPKVPIGSLPKSTGRIGFQLSKDGKPDTATITVAKVLGLSPAGFKSVAARELNGCRFDNEKLRLNGSVPVEATLSTAGPEVTVGSAEVVAAPSSPMAIEAFSLAHDTMPLAFDDARIEERPRPLNCVVQQKGTTVIHASGRSAAEAQADVRQQLQAMNEQAAATNSGTLTALVRVSVEGKPGSQLRVLEISNPMALQNLGDRIGGCRYVPARVLGFAVPAFYRAVATAGGVH